MGSTVRHIYDNWNGSAIDGMTLLLLSLGFLLLLSGVRARSLIFTVIGALILLDLPWDMSLTKRSGIIAPLLSNVGVTDL